VYLFSVGWIDSYDIKLIVVKFMYSYCCPFGSGLSLLLTIYFTLQFRSWRGAARSEVGNAPPRPDVAVKFGTIMLRTAVRTKRAAFWWNSIELFNLRILILHLPTMVTGKTRHPDNKRNVINLFTAAGSCELADVHLIFINL
jgi:hypothetical protein